MIFEGFWSGQTKCRISVFLSLCSDSLNSYFDLINFCFPGMFLLLLSILNVYLNCTASRQSLHSQTFKVTMSCDQLFNHIKIGYQINFIFCRMWHIKMGHTEQFNHMRVECDHGWSVYTYFNVLVREKRNSSVLAMELRLTCTNPSICFMSIWYNNLYK